MIRDPSVTYIHDTNEISASCIIEALFSGQLILIYTALYSTAYSDPLELLMVDYYSIHIRLHHPCLHHIDKEKQSLISFYNHSSLKTSIETLAHCPLKETY